MESTQHEAGISFWLADTAIRIRAAHYAFESVIGYMKHLEQNKLVPHPKTMNFVLSSMISRLNPKESKAQILKEIVVYLNRHNINARTIRLLCKLAREPSDLGIPWAIARRTKHPKQMICLVQDHLMEAACEAKFNEEQDRHLQLSKAFAALMRLEAMKIKPSKNAIVSVLRLCTRQCNLDGANAAIERLKIHGYEFQQEEAVEIIKQFPSNGLGTKSLALGEAVSPIFVRSEQLAFITYLRSYIKDTRFLGPYILALGRFGNSVEIWSVWNSLENVELKEGMLTCFVEAFVTAHDYENALEFVKCAYERGYMMNMHQIRLIAVGLGRRNRRIVGDLLQEIILQKADWNEEELREMVPMLSVGHGDGKGLVHRDDLTHSAVAELSSILSVRRDGQGGIVSALAEMDRITMKGQWNSDM
jgi:hypothetical protein